jgi:hypothetical protein
MTLDDVVRENCASKSSDELGDEASFISRLRDLTQDQLPDHSLQMLPRRWENLADWLAATPRKFRPLLLPNPGSLTRIGYTVKLAFPDRRDQKQLSELLDRAGLSGHEPPAGRVLTLVGSQRTRFRPSFLQAFDEFRRQVCRERDRCGAYGSIRPDSSEHRSHTTGHQADLAAALHNGKYRRLHAPATKTLPRVSKDSGGPFFVGEIQDLSRQIAKGGKRSYARSSACGGSSRRNLRGICSSSEAFVSLDIAPDNMIARRFDQDGAFRIGLTMAAPALLDSGFTERPKWLRSGI